MKLIVMAAACVAGMLSGCGAPPAAPVAPGGPVAQADGTFAITRKGETYYALPASLTAMATQDAQAHCLRIGKQFKAIHTRETPTRSGWTPESELLYRCE